MELILISESKLKVMLDAEDMKRYELSCETIEHEDPHARRAFWNILDEAKSRTGFDPAGKKVFVQVYPSRAGGCEMFVTKLAGAGAPAKQPEKQPNAALPSPPETDFVYRFERLSELLGVCRRLGGEIGYGDGTALTDEDGRWVYLILTKEIPWIAEYNGIRCRFPEDAYIRERCRCFCRDLSRLASLA